MSLLPQLASLALKGAAQAAGHVAGLAVVGTGVEMTVDVLKQRFSDNSTRLTKALERASGQAWRAVEISLAGHSWWDRCKLSLASGDERAIRQQVQAYLDANPLDNVDGHGPNFRGQCLAQLQTARKAGLLDKGRIDPDDLARRVGDLSRFGDQPSRVTAEFRVLDEVSARLRQSSYDALATFLALRPAAGPPLLLAAMRYFFQRELQRDAQLFQGLAYAKLDSLAEGQQAGFADLAETLEQHGERLEGMLAEVQAVVVQTHSKVLDVQAELQRQGKQIQDLGKAVLDALQQHQLERRELQGGDSMSIRDEAERRMVRDLIKRYRALPQQQRQMMPAMLNAVGKLEVVTGEYEAAERDFRELANMMPDLAVCAEANYNSYRASLERRAWDEALASFKLAIQLDAARFAPFPADKFEPERILGAGGFGVAFLCRNRHSSGRVVIKTLRRDGLERDVGEIFREAQTLEELEHPAIIRIRDCDYADTARTRPYLVMDYFQGMTLSEYVEQHGPVSAEKLLPLARLVAEGLQRAHSRGILHRDIKPANLLVRPSGQQWEAKLIDFGLALRASAASSTAKMSLDRTLAGASIAGTLEYAAPEQMGKLKGVAVGTYSDVYGFGKTCCFALFGTAQPTYQHWQKLPRELADLLGRCLAEPPRERPQDFAAVLRELGRKAPPAPAPRVEIPVPLMAARPIVDAEAVEEVVPVVPPMRAKPRRPEYDDHDEPAEPVRAGGNPGWIVFGVLLGIGVAVLGALMVFGMRVSPSGPPPLPPPPIEGFTKRVGTQPVEPAYDPIDPKDFPQVLKELEKPTPQRLKELAGRLSVTTPTSAQKEKRRESKTLVDLLKTQGTTRKAAFDAREADEIWKVSCALLPLRQQPDLESHKLFALACQKWGTSESVPELIGLLGATGYGTDVVRINAAKALGAIGDPRGIEPVAKRLADPWDRTRGIVDALVAFGPHAESAVWPSLSKDLNTQRAALEVLRQIGTVKSIPKLEALTGAPIRKEAANVIEIIKARTPKAG